MIYDVILSRENDQYIARAKDGLKSQLWPIVGMLPLLSLNPNSLTT